MSPHELAFPHRRVFYPRTEPNPIDEPLANIARKISNAPWNRPGTDKTWVVNAMTQALKFQREVRQAKRVDER